MRLNQQKKFLVGCMLNIIFSPQESSPLSLSPEHKAPDDSAMSPISNNSQSPNTSQRRKKVPPARRIPDEVAKMIKVEK